MARIRTIKPEHYDDEKMGNISIDANFLYIGMWVFSDDEGVIKGSPDWIRSKVFGNRPKVKTPKVIKLLKELENILTIFPFSFKNERYYLLVNLRRHQRIDKPQESRLPENVISEVKVKFQEYSKNVLACIVKDSKIFVKEREEATPPNDFENLNSENKEKNSPPSPPQKVQLPFTSQVFVELWDKWKDYKFKEFKKKYKSEESEQAALNHLVKLSKGYEDVASEIILQSMGNSWQGLFELKQQYGARQTTTGNGQQGNNAAYKEYLAAKNAANQG